MSKTNIATQPTALQVKLCEFVGQHDAMAEPIGDSQLAVMCWVVNADRTVTQHMELIDATWSAVRAWLGY